MENLARSAARIQDRAVAVLDAGDGDHHGQQQPAGVHGQVPLAAVDLLAGVVAAGARARCPQRTEAESITAALGLGCRPARMRARSRSASWMRAHAPAAAQRQSSP